MQGKEKGFWAAILLCLTIFLPGCGQHKEKELPTVRIGHASHDHHSPVFVATARPEYFKQHGNIYLKKNSSNESYLLMVNDQPRARVLFKKNIGGKELIRKLSEDQFDMVFGSISAVFYYIDQGASIRIAAPVMTEGAGLVLGNDIPARNWDEFVKLARAAIKPIRIGYKIEFSQNLIMEQALRAENLTFSDSLDKNDVNVQMLNLYGPKNLIPALKGHIIDGFVVNQPLLAITEDKKIGKTVTLLADMPPLGKWQNHPCCTLNIREPFYRTHPALAEELTAMFLRANEFIIKNQEESAEIVARNLNIPIDVERKSLETIKFQTEYSAEWNRGVDFMISSLTEGGELADKVVKAYHAGQTDKSIYELDLFNKARNRLKD